MAEIRSGSTDNQKPVIWPVIGKIWKTKTDIMTGAIGVRRNGAESFQEVVLKPGDRIALRPNRKREGKRDADYQICVIPAE